MNDIKIDLSEVNPQEFFGDQNANIAKLRTYFPKIKIVARGNTLKAYGEDSILSEFSKRVDMLIAHFGKFNILNDEIIERIVLAGTEDNPELDGGTETQILHGVGGKIIKAKTYNQKRLVESMHKNDMVFAVGPAGTGKTYTGVALAVKALKEKQVKRIILTRPAVEAGENLGFLPGDLNEKLDPYMQPLYDALNDFLPGKQLAKLIEEKRIEIAPLAFMRGRTLANAFVVLDEAQNATSMQMKMFLTRLGEGSRMVITGDRSQVDLPRGVVSGLSDAERLLKGIKGVGFNYFTSKDVVRHPLVAAIIEAYDDDSKRALIKNAKRSQEQ